MKKILVLLLLLTTTLFAEAVLTVYTDISSGYLYLNGVKRGNVTDSKRVKLALKPGKYKVEIKTDTYDAGYYYQGIGNIEIFDGEITDITVNTNSVYTEDYYYKLAKYRDNLGNYSLNNINDYIEKYPKGKYINEVKNILKDLENEKKKIISNLTENFIFVEKGTYTMGDTFGDGSSLEKPIHSVTVDSFYISKYETTQKEFNELMGFLGSYVVGADYPAENLTWYDAVMFANKLSEKKGIKPYYHISSVTRDGNKIKNATVTIAGGTGYRLPTESEWEYAARGGNKTKGYKYAGSNSIDEVSWYKNNSNSKTHQVGQKKSNELGIYDMSGNVSEWCWDWYGDYTSMSQINPIGVNAGTKRILRGGNYALESRTVGWGSNFELGTNYSRRFTIPWDFGPALGFRLVKNVDTFTGKKSIIYSDGSKYEGDFFNDKMTGKGTYTFSNGNKYEGDFLDGKMTGKGTYTFSNGSKYEGDFVNDFFEGKGTYTWASGNKYIGDFVNDKRTGNGIFMWADGDKFEGNFVNGNREGKGLMTFANGLKLSGTWKNDEYIGN